ncbi:MAG: hypothetical protein IT314_15815 [Anaerolineales bacterium]|nr:hypothetical protein [Anaerolineales bacterium]
MNKSIYSYALIVLIGVSVLACLPSNIPSLATATPQTLVTVPPMPTEFLPQPQTGTTPQSETGLENENLLTTIPDGFKVDYQAEQNNQIITEMVAEGESVQNWTTLITVQIFLGNTSTSPEQFQDNLTQLWFGACPNSESYPVADGIENGYNFVLWQLYCPLNPSTQKVEFTYIKAIQGNDSLYSVQVAFRYQPTDDDITRWMQYLKTVQVCDSRIPERACP